jgi:hypothetical protein
MDWAYVNPFSGYINFSNFKIHELNSDSIFFSANDLSLNISILKLFSKTYEISKLTLNQPRGIIIQDNNNFNYKDLIDIFSSKNNLNTTKVPIHFSILGIKINNGEFYFREKQIPIYYYIKNVNLESTGKNWDTDTIYIKYSFLSGMGSGDVKGDITINFNSLDYRFAVAIHKFDLNIIGQYLKDITNYGSFSANLDANINAIGNFSDSENITTRGLLAINNFHFGKTAKDDYASFDKLALEIIELSPKYHKYLFDSVSLNHPYFKYENYDYLDNMQTMFGENGSNIIASNSNTDKFNLVIELAKYIKVLAHNFFESSYKINRLAIYKGDLKFNDYSISEKFSIGLNPLSIVADSIDKTHKRVNVFFKSGIKPHGNASVTLSINPKDSSDFDLYYQLQKLPVSMFNPYTITYTSYPLDRGSLDVKGTWHVSNGIIKSDNHLVIIDPRVTKRIRNKDIKWIPMPLIMSFIRERGNVIDYEIPITGDLKNPKFHLHDVIFDILKNMVIKPATTPYRMEVKNIESKIEKSLSLKWKMRQNSLEPKQKRFISKIVDFLKNNPEASIAVYPIQYASKEREYIRYFEAKKKYFLLNAAKNSRFLSEDDSLKVNKMSVRDTFFVQYLNKHIRDTMLFTLEEKCNNFIGSANINKKFNHLNKERESVFMEQFINNNVGNKVKFYSGINNIPFNGFSFFKIVYKGELPRSLIKAYEQMNDLNNIAPRNKYKTERRKYRKLF